MKKTLGFALVLIFSIPITPASAGDRPRCLRGDDRIDGGEGLDTVDGNSGSDSCASAEVATNCEQVTPAVGARLSAVTTRRTDEEA